MKVIIAGSRTITDYNYVTLCYLDTHWKATEIVSGCARGVDSIAIQMAECMAIPVKRMPAQWENGKGAGFTRNIAMADYADALIAIWDGTSRGTAHMIQTAKKKGLAVYVYVKDKPVQFFPKRDSGA